MKHPWKNKVACPDCGKEVKYLAQHQKMAHGKEVTLSKEGEEMAQERDDEVRRLIAEEKEAAEQAKREESERSSIVAGIKGIGERLDKMDTDFCSKFPDLCVQVNRLEEAMPKKPEEGSEEWKTETRAGLDHVLFDDCPNCRPLRDEVLAAKGKRLADVEAEAKVESTSTEAKAEESKAKEEAKVEETETKVEEEGSELKTSPGYFSGAKWDEEKQLYVEVREG